MTQLRKTLVLASGLLVAVIAGWILLRPAAGGAAPADAAAPHAVVAPGLVEAQSERIELGFAAGGRVAEGLVEEGERVTRGQVLGRLGAPPAAARRRGRGGGGVGPGAARPGHARRAPRGDRRGRGRARGGAGAGV